MTYFGNGSGEDIDEMLDAAEGYNPEFLHLNKHDSLLDSCTRLDACANAKVWRGMWVRCDSQWLKFKVNVDGPFLNALGAICKRARVERCQNGKCVELMQHVELAAPVCAWRAFREWAIVAISCQYSMGHVASELEKEHRPHTHIASAVGMMNTLLEEYYEEKDKSAINGVLLGSHSRQTTFNVAGITDVIYWMLTVQTKMGRNTVDFESWPLDYILRALVQPSIKRAERRATELGLCLYRVHTLAYASSRKAAEIPAIVAGASRRPELALRDHGHKQCTASSCRLMYSDNTSCAPLHDASKGKTCHCSLRLFSHSKLCVAIKQGLPAVWSSEQPDTLILPDTDHRYIAISHTWADGTGAHPDHPGSVNACMFDFFAGIAARLGCVGIWWDAISIPAKHNDADLRAQAIRKMHHNYTKASYTVVHDAYLRRFEWREGDNSCPGDACLAVALSPWFSRGWTSLELHVSHKVVVLFASRRTRTRSGDNSNTIIIQPLNKILCKHPALSPRAHWIAALLIKKVWHKRIKNVSDILAIMHPRGTSWSSDIKLIQAHFAGCGDDPDLATEQSEMVFTRRILTTVGSVRRSALLHGFETLAPSGPFSWCPRALSDMPISLSDDFEGSVSDDLVIHRDGHISGMWFWRYLQLEDTKAGALVLHQPALLCERVLNDEQQSYRLEQKLSSTPPESVLQTALRNWRMHLLLSETMMHNAPTILVETLGRVKEKRKDTIIDCRYIATVEERWEDALSKPKDTKYEYDFIRLGHPEAGEHGVDIRPLIQDDDDSSGDNESETDSEDLISGSEGERTGDEVASDDVDPNSEDDDDVQNGRHEVLAHYISERLNLV